MSAVSVRRTWVAVYALLALSAVAAGYAYYRVETAAISREKHQVLAAIGQLKSAQIQHWRNERLALGRRASRNQFLAQAVAEFIREPSQPGRRTRLEKFLTLEKMAGLVERVLLLGPDGDVLLRAGEVSGAVNPATRRAFAAVLASGDVALSDFFRDPGGDVYIDTVAPILDGDRRPLAAVALRSDASTYLYPLIRSWPIPSRSAETFFVQRDGEDVVFLNELRHRPTPALALRTPLTSTDAPAVQAVLGKQGLFEGHDYRGVAVVADLRSIPGSPWFLVAKIDADELLGEVRYRAIVTTIVVGSLMLLGAVMAAYAYRRRQLGIVQGLYESEIRGREAQRAFRTVLNSIGDAVISTDTEGQVLGMNPVAEELTGWREAEALGRSIVEVLPLINAMTRAPVESPVSAVLRTGTVLGLANHTLLVARDGTERPVADSAAPIRDESGEVGGVVLTFSDQSVQYAARQALIESERDLRAAQTIGRLGTYVFDILAGTWKSSGLLDDILGIDAGFPRTVDGWAGLVHPSDRDGMRAYFRGIVANHQRFEREFVIVRRNDGTERWVRALGEVEYRADGTPVRMVGTAQDITEQRRAEESIRVQAHMLDHIGQAVIATDVGGIVTYANRLAEVLYGWSAAEMIGRNALEFMVPQESRTQAEQIMAQLRDGKAWAGESLAQRRDGSVFPALVTESPLPDRAGTMIGTVGVSTDMTRFKEIEAQFLQAQKMEVVGQLAGGIAHDFNNLLTVINGTADLAMTSMTEDHPLRADCMEIHRAGQLAAALTRQLLAFSRKQMINPQVVDLDTLIRDSHSMFQRLVGEDIELVIVPAAQPGSVQVDPGQVEQVLMNLVVNARDAMPAGGRLTIETRNGGDQMILSVSDIGTGMNEATRARVLEPFFTTKETGKGSGLGLSTVQYIVQQSGGSIHLDSALGKGTTVTIRLPRCADAVGRADAARKAAIPHGAETILVVEDEEAILYVAKRILQAAGYTVLTAGSGEAALRLLERHDGPVHLMLTDVVMPGLSGRDLAAQLARVRPGMKVIFSSGYTDDVVLRHGVADGAVHFMGKPYSLAELTQKVREVLDS